MIKKMFIAALLILSAQAWAVEPIPIDPLKMKLPEILKQANLTMQFVSWSGEICGLYGCPEFTEIKQQLGIDKATCPVVVRVANLGNAPAGAFSVQLIYPFWNGSQEQKLINLGTGLAAKNTGTWYHDFTFSNLGYYRRGQPFKVKVDFYNQIPESNEGDNDKSVVLP